MKTLILFLLITIGTFGQNIKRDVNGNFYQVKNTSSQFKKQPEIPTNYTYTDSKGNIFPVFVAKSGTMYVNKISKKTGKPYRSYLEGYKLLRKQ